MKTCALLLALLLPSVASAATSYWSFDGGPTDVISTQGDTAATLGMTWSDGGWSITGDPDLTWGLLLTMHSGQPGPLALVRSDQRIIGVHGDPTAAFSGGAVGVNAWLIAPSPHDYRVVVEVPHAVLRIDSLTITNELVTLGPDLNYDGRVDIFDINLVSAKTGTTGPVGDANADGAVNIFDINAVSSAWTEDPLPGVDEPSTFSLALAALILLNLLTHSRRRLRSPPGTGD